MASGYLDNTTEVTAEDLEAFYSNMQGGSNTHVASNDITNIEELVDDSSIDSQDLDYQLQLYAEGKLDDLSTLLENENNTTTTSTVKPYNAKREKTSNDLKLESKFTKNTKPKNVRNTESKKSRIEGLLSPIKFNQKTNLNSRSQIKRPQTKRSQTRVPQKIKTRPSPQPSPQNDPKENPDSPKANTIEPRFQINQNISNKALAIAKEKSPTPPMQEDAVQTDDSISPPKLNEMHSIMRSWLEIDDEIKEINKIAKTLREKKRELTGQLLKDMNTFKVGVLSEGTQQLKYAVSYRKEGYKKSYIEEKLTEYLGDSGVASQIAEYLEESRGKNEKLDIRRGKVKIPKK